MGTHLGEAAGVGNTTRQGAWSAAVMIHVHLPVLVLHPAAALELENNNGPQNTTVKKQDRHATQAHSRKGSRDAGNQSLQRTYSHLISCF